LIKNFFFYFSPGKKIKKKFSGKKNQPKNSKKKFLVEIDQTRSPLFLKILGKNTWRIYLDFSSPEFQTLKIYEIRTK